MTATGSGGVLASISASRISTGRQDSQYGVRLGTYTRHDRQGRVLHDQCVEHGSNSDERVFCYFRQLRLESCQHCVPPYF